MTKINEENFFFFDKNVSDIEIYPNSIEHAYFLILNEDLNSAEKIFAKNDSPRGIWGISLTNILRGYVSKYPTFFQIRNFMEIDVDFLLKNNKISYVEQFLGSLEFLSTINQETYKFIARVMYENRLLTAALKYMEKSKQIYYQDPELHYMLAKYYLSGRCYEDAEFYINECLKLLPEYYPALILKEKIEEMIV